MKCIFSTTEGKELGCSNQKFQMTKNINNVQQHYILYPNRPESRNNRGYYQYNKRFSIQTRSKNLLDKKGYPTGCWICENIYHYANKSPEKTY